MSLTIRYLDTPEGAQEAALVTSADLQPFAANTSMVTGAEDTPWATLETGGWVLDGSRDILPDEPEDIGWWSSTRSADEVKGFILGQGILGVTPLGVAKPGGDFSDPPLITIDFEQRFSATGITLTFSPSTEQWCTDILVKWYREGELLAEISGRPGTAQWSGGGPVDSFDRITLELMATNQPGQLAKIQQIVVGKTIVFGREEIVSAQLVNEIDHTLGTLPVDTSRFEVTGPDGLLLHPQERQRLELYRDGQLLASHYIVTSTREVAGQYVLDCQSAIGLLEDDFLGGIYDDEPMKNVVSDILGDIQYEIAQELDEETITGYIPVCTRREALQQVAFAVGALATTWRSSRIRLVPLAAGEATEFTPDGIFPGARLERSSRVAKCEVTVHRYKKSNTEEVLLEDEDVDGLVTFPDPHWDYSITGGEITASGANWLRVTASGPVTVTAKTYIHTTSIRSRTNPDATYAERSNVMAVSEATLVTKANAQKVLDRLYVASQLRHELSQDAIITDQSIGDDVTSSTPWRGQIRGIITSMDSTLTQNGHTAAVRIVGEEV